MTGKVSTGNNTVLSAYVTGDTIARVDALVRAQGRRRSHWLRSAVKEKLARETAKLESA